MKASNPRSNKRSSWRRWLRRAHRWLGLAAVFFIVLLSATGIALNHGNDWGLDRNYVRWDWAITALGLDAPDPSASYVDQGQRVTTLGKRVYLNRLEIAAEVDSLRGIIVLDSLVVVATSSAVLLLTNDGELVERVDLAADLDAAIDRVGRLDTRPVLNSGGSLYIGDAAVTAFVPWDAADAANVTWSLASEPGEEDVAALRDLYAGRVLTVERFVLELHSGRLIGAAGPLLLDIVAVALIVLSVSGVFVWLWGGRGNGSRGSRRRNRLP